MVVDKKQMGDLLDECQNMAADTADIMNDPHRYSPPGPAMDVPRYSLDDYRRLNPALRHTDDVVWATGYAMEVGKELCFLKGTLS